MIEHPPSSIPPVDNPFRGLVRDSLNHRLIYVFLFALSCIWLVESLCIIFSFYTALELGILGWLMTPFEPTTFMASLLIGLLVVLPVYRVRVDYLIGTGYQLFFYIFRY
jgi:hypothetical protein